MSQTPGTGEMRAAMRDAVKRSKGNSKQARIAKSKWKEVSKKKRKVWGLLILGVLGPLAMACILYPLHSFGIIRLWKPAPLSKALSNPDFATKLDLSKQYLTTVPQEIEGLKNLNILILDSNELQTLAPQVFALPKLEVLSANNNRLKSLPPEASKMTALKQLHLTGNGLTTLPPEIFSLSELEVLVLKDNALSEVPEELVKLQKLKVLDLKGNNISTLPEGLSKLKNLETVSLAGNKLNGIPNLSGLKQLKRVVLRDTGLNSAEIDILRKRLGTEVAVNS